jgi:hypothetical protein
MTTIIPLTGEARARTLAFLACPDVWQFWPFLPLVRRKPDGVEELGVAYDALHARGLPGYSTTVFLTNLFCLPQTLEELLALPKESYDAPEELVDAGWGVD